jgi:hypothetical protein
MAIARQDLSVLLEVYMRAEVFFLQADSRMVWVSEAHLSTYSSRFINRSSAKYSFCLKMEPFSLN